MPRLTDAQYKRAYEIFESHNEGNSDHGDGHFKIMCDDLRGALDELLTDIDGEKTDD